jgi:hypothetical protein
MESTFARAITVANRNRRSVREMASIQRIFRPFWDLTTAYRYVESGQVIPQTSNSEICSSAFTLSLDLVSFALVEARNPFCHRNGYGETNNYH